MSDFGPTALTWRPVFGPVPPITRSVPVALSTARRVVTMTDGATITPNSTTTDIGQVTLGGNRTMGVPSGSPSDGQALELRVYQDGTGNRLLAWNAIWAFPATFPSPTLSTAAGALDIVGFRYNTASNKWNCIGYVLGF